MRQVDEWVSQWSCGRYFLFWRGDEFLLDALTDEQAVIAGRALRAELELE